MMGCALLKLGKLATAAARSRYDAAGRKTIDALIGTYLTPTASGDTRARGILTEGCWQRNEGQSTRHELIWGDYYLFEALAMLTDKLPRLL
jgi:unsaturated chondroitin disaccharide hydrolase